MFGYRKFPCLSLGSIPIPLALEASALTTELHRCLKYAFIYVCYGINACFCLFFFCFFFLVVVVDRQHKTKICECCFSRTVRYLISNTLNPVKPFIVKISQNHVLFQKEKKTKKKKKNTYYFKKKKKKKRKQFCFHGNANFS